MKFQFVDTLTASPFHVAVYVVFLQNFFMAAYNDLGFPWAIPTWSLAVEEHFYLLIPLLLRICGSLVLPFVCLGAVLATLALRTVLLLHFHVGWIPVYVLSPRTARRRSLLARCHNLP